MFRRQPSLILKGSEFDPIERITEINWNGGFREATRGRSLIDRWIANDDNSSLPCECHGAVFMR